MNREITVVDTTEMELEDVRRGRVHMIRRKRLPLDTGVPGLTMEYSLSVVPEGYFTPRHRHNFDQIRYTLHGVQSTGYGDLGPGEIGYFPEGAYYGPQSQQGECVALVLQFQGASGEHLLSNEEMNETYEKLIAKGAKFENGIYRGLTADGRRKNKDSYVAIWEEHEGHKLKFPALRYRSPIMMQPENFNWVIDRKRPGIEAKHLGTFSEMRTAVGFFRMLPGTRMPAEKQEDAELRYVTEGEIQYRGRSWGVGTYFYVPPEATVEGLSSKTGATFFTITLPMVAEVAARQRDEQQSAAAE